MERFKLTMPAIRVKLTGICNRSCSFCHEEGDMKGIYSIKADKKFFNCLHTLMDVLEVRRIMLTGGEPTVHPQFREVVSGVNAEEISLTTNGIKFKTVEE